MSYTGTGSYTRSYTWGHTVLAMCFPLTSTGLGVEGALVTRAGDVRGSVLSGRALHAGRDEGSWLALGSMVAVSSARSTAVPQYYSLTGTICIHLLPVR